MEWPAHPPLEGGRVSVLVSERIIYNNLGHEKR